MTPRQKVTWFAHFWKATTRQHHKEMRLVFRPCLPPDGIAPDVGAHAGQFTRLFAGMCPRGHVHAFEPGCYALSVLRRMRAIRRLSNVTIHPYGLGEVEETLTLNVPLKGSGSVGFGLGFIGDAGAVTRQMTIESIAIRRLDDVVEARAIPHIEGSELRMLKGAKATLSRFGPALFCRGRRPPSRSPR